MRDSNEVSKEDLEPLIEETYKELWAKYPDYPGNGEILLKLGWLTFRNRVNDLPVDWHMLIALIAPRPVYISVAEEDYWGDPRGSFLAAKYAEPVYKLFEKRGLSDPAIATPDRDVNDMPPVETPVGDFIGFHSRKGGHGITNYDWEQFLSFSDRHFGITKPSK